MSRSPATAQARAAVLSSFLPSRHVVQRNLDKAAILLNNGRRNVAGLLAQAAVAFELGDHAGALTSYRKALKEFPGCPPEVRTQSETLQYLPEQQPSLPHGAVVCASKLKGL